MLCTATVIKVLGLRALASLEGLGIQGLVSVSLAGVPDSIQGA